MQFKEEQTNLTETNNETNSIGQTTFTLLYNFDGENLVTFVYFPSFQQARKKGPTQTASNLFSYKIDGGGVEIRTRARDESLLTG